MRVRLAVLLTASIVGASLAACSSDSSPAGPSRGTLSAGNMTGTWTGLATDAAGQQQMTWTIQQQGTSVTATANLADSHRNLMGRGTMQGTLDGRTLTFEMTVPQGGFGGMMGPCAMGMDGHAELSEDGHTLTGTYEGMFSGMMGQMQQSCGGALGNGRFTLTR